MKNLLLLSVVFGLASVSYSEKAATAVTTAASPAVLTDGDNAKFARVDGLHQTRFIEIFLAGRDAKTGSVVAACYNTMFSAGVSSVPKDTSPQGKVEGLDLDKMKKDYGVLGASLNGPKLWLPDWTEVQLGAEREFNGMKAGWIAQLNMGKQTTIQETVEYKPMTIARKSRLGWNKGTTVLLLDDAEGNTWILKGFQLGLKPRITYDDFLKAGAGNFKKLPKGWKVRLKTLDKDYIETPEGGVATIMSDEHFNVYDKTGPGMSNFKL